MNAPQAEAMGKPPAWVPELLLAAAEHMAARAGASARVRFKVLPGDRASTWTAEAFWSFDPSTARLRLCVRDADSGRFVCQSKAVIVDELDEAVWNTDLHSNLV